MEQLEADVSTPPLDRLVADASRLEDVPKEELPNLLADLERLRAEVWTRIARPSPQNGVRSRDQTDQGTADQLLDVEAVAERLDVTERYVYDHADEWPFTRRISPRKLRFSERGLHRWLETRP